MVWVGLAMLFIGFLVVVAGMITASGSYASSGGFILIGPIPIVFGNGPNSGTLAIVGAALTAVMVAVYLLSFLLWRRNRSP